jgi:hypothetical protein
MPVGARGYRGSWAVLSTNPFTPARAWACSVPGLVVLLGAAMTDSQSQELTLMSSGNFAVSGLGGTRPNREGHGSKSQRNVWAIIFPYVKRCTKIGNQC